MSKYCQYHRNHGHDMDDCRHLKIEIEMLIQRGQLKEYARNDTYNITGTVNRGSTASMFTSMNKHFNRGRSQSPDVLLILLGGIGPKDKWNMARVRRLNNINKVCPKDGYPLPNIDLLVDSSAAYKVLDFLDAWRVPPDIHARERC
ncbi:hypothetical protein LIER_18698 [Lithospermum erythrorhizon]|uniref:Uncharacterized protein n=1 Tax=Lithospermum erythrorhizon TaxID=34254 RepID=A0AAV3QKC4_LITER